MNFLQQIREKAARAERRQKRMAGKARKAAVARPLLEGAKREVVAEAKRLMVHFADNGHTWCRVLKSETSGSPAVLYPPGEIESAMSFPVVEHLAGYLQKRGIAVTITGFSHFCPFAFEMVADWSKKRRRKRKTQPVAN